MKTHLGQNEKGRRDVSQGEEDERTILNKGKYDDDTFN